MLNLVLTPQGMEVPESLMIPSSSQATWGNLDTVRSHRLFEIFVKSGVEISNFGST